MRGHARRNGGARMPKLGELTDMAFLASDFGGFVYLAIVMLLIAGCVLLSIVSIILLLLAAYRLRDTTLVAPVAWVIMSLMLWTYAVAALMRDTQGSPLPADRQTIGAIALLSTACPNVAVLGARRPQNKIWPLVVASLLLILILPELPSMLGQGDLQLVHNVWKWFFAGLLIVGWLNFLPTRLMLGATLWCLPGLWWACSGTVHWLLMLAPGLACTVGVLAAKQRRMARSQRGWNRVWRDFRNLYGVVWALRVMERTNALANSAGAAVALDWWGFHDVPPPQVGNPGPAAIVELQRAPTPQQLALIEPGLRNLLRRFVSDRWIDARLASAPSPMAH